MNMFLFILYVCIYVMECFNSIFIYISAFELVEILHMYKKLIALQQLIISTDLTIL